MNENEIHLLRAAPEPLPKAFTPTQAIDAAKKAFHAARREQFRLMALYLNQMLFDPCTVDRRRLMGLRTEARKQVEHAMRVEQLLNDAIEAFEATR